MKPLLIKNGIIVTETDTNNMDILCENGIITKIEHNINIPDANIVDATGLFVLPGGVDQHVHFNFSMNNNTYYSWASSKAATVSGTTTVIDFLNQKPNKSIKESLDEYTQLAIKGNTFCDYGLHIILNSMDYNTLDELKNLLDYGIGTCKIFTAFKGETHYCPDEVILKILSLSKEVGFSVMVHAENPDIIKMLQQKSIYENKLSPDNHYKTRPYISEIEAVSKMIYFAEFTGANICFAHISTKESVELIKNAKKRGLNVFGETCPHYLLFTQEQLDKSPEESIKFICSPPLREKYNLQHIWKALQEDVLSFISSDHSDINWKNHKMFGLNNYLQVPNGCPGLAERFPIIWSEGVKKGFLTPQQFVKLCCTNPAKFNGLYPKKGTLSIGSDADIVLLNTNKKTIIHPSPYTISDYSIYDKMVCECFIEKVFIRGKLMAEKGKFVGSVLENVFVPAMF